MCGPDGVPPGVLKLLPAHWITFIVFLFNSIFLCGEYPLPWATAKFFTIFKGGSRSLVKNYRGISVLSSVAKLYDMVLCSRLERWFIPHREQAGSQAGRGCIELIVTLRLLIDMAKKRKLKLFIVFVDFAKAYDNVKRNILFAILKRLGCGMLMLTAIISMYTVTNSILGTALISACVGVRQGFPTSCLLFVLYVNDMISLIKKQLWYRWLPAMVTRPGFDGRHCSPIYNKSRNC